MVVEETRGEGRLLLLRRGVWEEVECVLMGEMVAQ